MKQFVFISRFLSPDSIFLQKLEKEGFEVIGESLVVFSLLPFAEIPPCDWLFFYSPTAVRFFFDHLRQANLQCHAKVAALGFGTARTVLEQGFTVDFIGRGEPEATAQAFLKIAAHQQVVFPRAENSRQSIQQLLGDKIMASDLIVYKNQARTEFILPNCQYLVFTSPLNAQAYFSKYKLISNQTLIAIGKTTARALHQLGVAKIHIADAPSEEALANLIIGIASR